jgi:hypothetical protein
MGRSNRIEVEFDERAYEGLVTEAERLGVGVEELVGRAAAAWLIEIAEETPAVRS